MKMTSRQKTESLTHNDFHKISAKVRGINMFWGVFTSYLWYVMTETILPVAEEAKLSKCQHRRLTLDKAAHAVSLLHSVDERIEIVVQSSGCGDVAGARLHFALS